MNADRAQFYRELWEKSGGHVGTAARMGEVNESTIRRWWRRLGLPTMAQKCVFWKQLNNTQRKILARIQQKTPWVVLLDEFGCSPHQMIPILQELRDRGLSILWDEAYVWWNLAGILTESELQGTTDIEIDAEEFALGIIADTHLGHRDADIEALHKLYALFEKAGVSAVLHAGDLTDGLWGYGGQEAEAIEVTLSGHMELLRSMYPRINGVTTYVISGNHEGFIMRRTGLSILDWMASVRDDIVHMGWVRQEININGWRIWLFHPDGSPGKSKEVWGEQLIEDWVRAGETLPDLVVVGHAHRMGWFEIYGTWVCYPGHTQHSTNFMEGRRLLRDKELGGVILEVKRGKDGYQVTPRFIKLGG